MAYPWNLHGLEVVQGRWKWHYWVDHARLFVGLPFSSYLTLKNVTVELSYAAWVWRREAGFIKQDFLRICTPCCTLLDERASDILMWKEELLSEIRADEVEMDNLKVTGLAGKIVRLWCLVSTETTYKMSPFIDFMDNIRTYKAEAGADNVAYAMTLYDVGSWMLGIWSCVYRCMYGDF